MIIILEHTKDEHCNEVTDFDKYILFNDSIKAISKDIHISKKAVEGFNSFIIKIYVDDEVKEIPATRLDLVTDFIKEYYNIK